MHAAIAAAHRDQRPHRRIAPGARGTPRPAPAPRRTGSRRVAQTRSRRTPARSRAAEARRCPCRTRRGEMSWRARRPRSCRPGAACGGFSIRSGERRHLVRKSRDVPPSRSRACSWAAVGGRHARRNRSFAGGCARARLRPASPASRSLLDRVNQGFERLDLQLDVDGRSRFRTSAARRSRRRSRPRPPRRALRVRRSPSSRDRPRRSRPGTRARRAACPGRSSATTSPAARRRSTCTSTCAVMMNATRASIAALNGANSTARSRSGGCSTIGSSTCESVAVSP